MITSVRFLKKFIRSPATIGSIIPSSPALVSSLLAAINWSQTRIIVELGAGTGAVTRSINDKRLPGSTFLSFERDQQMQSDLRRQFPDIDFCNDAFGLDQILAERGHERVDCVVSCLPFANFSRHQQALLLGNIHRSLRPGGLFIAFQYSNQLRPSLSAVYDDIDCQLVMLNIPPALVYVCRKQATG